ncbi:MAG: tetratricopeptide repeat protein, partial [candidate division Zixibacteria bacterium]|nr:tetratricopeptide repeat protein [candidate division Zixibacteria bacterium]
RFARLNPGVPVYLQFVELPDGESKLVPEGFFLKYDKRSSLDEFYFTEQLHFLEEFYKELLDSPELDLGTRENFGNFFFNWGVFFDRLGMVDNSYLNFTRALDIDPTNDRYYTAIGKGFLKSGKFEEAEKFFLAAIELNPYSDENRELLSQCEKARNVQDRQ